MPWSQLSPMDQKTQFIADYLRCSLFKHLHGPIILMTKISLIQYLVHGSL
jgi:hypothetical protein